MQATRSMNHYSRSTLKRRRKVAVLKRRILILAVTIILIVLGVLIGSNLSAAFRNKAANERISYKYYTSIQVEVGENLWNIAGKYFSDEYASRQDYMEELIAVNNLKDDTIYAGQYLTVPYYSEEYK